MRLEADRKPIRYFRPWMPGDYTIPSPCDLGADQPLPLRVEAQLLSDPPVYGVVTEHDHVRRRSWFVPHKREEGPFWAQWVELRCLTVDKEATEHAAYLQRERTRHRRIAEEKRKARG